MRAKHEGRGAAQSHIAGLGDGGCGGITRRTSYDDRIRAVTILRNELFDVDFTGRHRADSAKASCRDVDVKLSRSVGGTTIACDLDIEKEVVAGAGGDAHSARSGRG